MSLVTTTLTAAALAAALMHGTLTKTCADVKSGCARLEVLDNKTNKEKR